MKKAATDEAVKILMEVLETTDSDILRLLAYQNDLNIILSYISDLPSITGQGYLQLFIFQDQGGLLRFFHGGDLRCRHFVGDREGLAGAGYQFRLLAWGRLFRPSGLLHGLLILLCLSEKIFTLGVALLLGIVEHEEETSHEEQ